MSAGGCEGTEWKFPLFFLVSTLMASLSPQLRQARRELPDSRVWQGHPRHQGDLQADCHGGRQQHWQRGQHHILRGIRALLYGDLGLCSNNCEQTF